MNLCLSRPEVGCQAQAKNIGTCMSGGGSAQDCASNCDTRADCSPPAGGSSSGTGSGTTPGGGGCDAQCQAERRCMSSHPKAVYCNFFGGHCCCYDKDGNCFDRGLCPL